MTSEVKMTSHNYPLFTAALLVCLSLAGCNANRTEAARKDDAQRVMQLSVQKFDSVKEVKYPWGWIRWMMNSELDPAASQTFGIVQINAGQRNPLHKHPNCEELLYVLSGSFENVVGDKKVVLHAGDILRIPADTPHQGINNTHEPMRAVISYSLGTRQMVALEANKE
jgi:quercetin dioxygenase-like cupin family protein